MTINEQLRSLFILLRKEVLRFFRIWSQTLIPSVLTTILYFLIFGTFIGERIGKMSGFDYMQFMAPGLVMLAVITNAYSNVVSSFFGVKFQRSIEELLVSPMPTYLILIGFVLGGVVRGIIVGFIISRSYSKKSRSNDGSKESFLEENLFKAEKNLEETLLELNNQKKELKIYQQNTQELSEKAAIKETELKVVSEEKIKLENNQREFKIKTKLLKCL